MFGKIVLGALGLYSLTKKNPITASDKKLVGSFIATMKNVMDKLYQSEVFKGEYDDEIIDFGVNLVFEWDVERVGFRAQTEMENDGMSRLEYVRDLAYEHMEGRKISKSDLPDRFDDKTKQKLIQAAKGLASVFKKFGVDFIYIDDQFGWDIVYRGFTNTSIDDETKEFIKNKVTSYFPKIQGDDLEEEEGVVFLKKYKGY